MTMKLGPHGGPERRGEKRRMFRRRIGPPFRRVATSARTHEMVGRAAGERRQRDRRNSDLIASLGRRHRSVTVENERRTDPSPGLVGRRDVMRFGRRKAERRNGVRI